LIRAKSNFICGCGFDRWLDKPFAQSRCCGNGAFASAVVARLSKSILDWQKTLSPGPVEPLAGRNDYRWPGKK
jgi:hypothetical protein